MTAFNKYTKFITDYYNTFISRCSQFFLLEILMSAAIYKNKLYMSLNCSYHLPIDIGVPAGYALHQMKMIVLQLG